MGDKSGTTTSSDKLNMGNLVETCSSSTMDDSLWGQMPHEVLIRVLSFLPLARLFQLRCVCKRWSNVIYCPDFIRICVEVKAPAMSPQPAVCYVYSPGGFRWSLFDNTEKRWQLMPCYSGNSGTNHEISRKREIYVATGGLLCLLEVGSVDLMKTLTVWNPLTNQGKELPSFINLWSYPLVRFMFEDAKNKSYKVVLSGNQNYQTEDDRFVATEIYDSGSGCWREGGNLLPSLRFPFSNGAFCKGVLYYLASRPMTMYDILIKYDIEEDEWSEVSHIIPIDTYCTPYLFECEGRLLMMMHLLTGTARMASCGIFDLNFETKEWEMLTEMPQEIYMDFAYIGGCIASGQKQLCVTGNAPNRDLIVVVYEMIGGVWLWLPPCPLTSSDYIERHSTFSFHPTFCSEV